MCKTTIELSGVVEEISEIITNERTGFVKKVIQFKPDHGKAFYPEFHYHKMRLLNDIQIGDPVTIEFKIWGSTTRQINNVIAEQITRKVLANDC